jgi:hypothetical protein
MELLNLFEIFVVINIKIMVFCNVTPCIVEDKYQHSGGTYVPNYIAVHPRRP